MIKIFHTADWHIDQLSKWSSEKSKKYEWVSKMSEYHLDVLDSMIDDCIEDECDIFIFAWDLFHDSLSNHKEKDSINKVLQTFINRLRENDIKIVFISGNHDITKRSKEYSKFNSLEIFHNIQYGVDEDENEILFVNGPESKEIEYRDYIINGEELRIILFPYLRDTTLSKLMISDQIQELSSEKRSILVWHLDVWWAKYIEDGWEIKSTNPEDVNTWTEETLEDLWCDLVLLWHIHNTQVLGEQESVIYSWSPYRLTFNEETSPKWYYIHTLNEDVWNSEFIELETTPWKTVKIDLKKETFTDLLEMLKKLKDVDNWITRIIINNVKREDYKYIPYEEIKSILDSKGVYLNRWVFTNSDKEENISIKDKSVSLDTALGDEKLKPESILERLLVNEWYTEEEREKYQECLELLRHD